MYLSNNISPMRLDMYHHGGKIIDSFGNKVSSVPFGTTRQGKTQFNNKKKLLKHVDLT